MTANQNRREATDTLVRELVTYLDPCIQLSIANEIFSRLHVFNPSITLVDAICRITEMYDYAEHDPEQLAMEFFNTPQWRQQVEAQQDQFWNDSGIEILNAPLHDWLKNRGIRHRNQNPTP